MVTKKKGITFLLCTISPFLAICYIITYVNNYRERASILFEELNSRIIKHSSNVRQYHPKKETTHHCKEENRVESRYAVVSLLTLERGDYVSSALKLARSVRWWLNPSDADLIMMTTEFTSLSTKLELKHAGWKICTVPIIEPSKINEERSRFIEAKMYTKLNVWALTEYEAALFLDSDTLVIRDLSYLFSYHLNNMNKKKQTIGAALDRPLTMRGMNAGVLLLIPKQKTFEMLKTSIETVKHDTNMAEQALLNVIYENSPLLYELPFIYNANLYSKLKEKDLWEKNSNNVVILHYTVSKGWQNPHRISMYDPGYSLHCWEWDTCDMCELWEKI